MNSDIINDFKNLFKCRIDVYAECVYSKKKSRYQYFKKNKKLTNEVIKKHLNNSDFGGVGIYPLIQNEYTKWIAIDFDIHNKDERKEVEQALDRIYETVNGIELNMYLEISKSGQGYHLWLFMNEKIKSWKLRRLMMAILQLSDASDLSSMDRFFPAQDRIKQNMVGFGNLIHLPFCKKFIDQGTYFKDRFDREYRIDDLDAFLEAVNTESIEKIENILDVWDLKQEVPNDVEYEQDDHNYEYAEDGLQKVLEDPYIKWCSDNPKKVDYNAWLGLISNLLPYGDDGIKAIHDISRKDPARYDKKDCQKQIIAWQGNNPITYNWLINNTNFDKDITDKVNYKAPAAAGVKKSSFYTRIYENKGRYWLKVGKKTKMLSNFLIKPKKYVQFDNDSKMEGIFDIQTRNKTIKNQHIAGDILAKKSELNNYLLTRTRSAAFRGTTNDLLELLDYLEDEYPDLKIASGKRAVGMHFAKRFNKWAVVTQNQAWTSSGVYKEFIYYNTIKKEILFTNKVNINKKETINVIDHLFDFNEIETVSKLLGWIGCLFVKQRLYENKGFRFPILMIHGQAGSGKSETIKHFLQKMCGDISKKFSVGDLTRFTLLKFSESTNMFPLFLDEYKATMFKRSKKNMISQIVRNAYDNSVASRGRPDQTTVDYRIVSPLVIAGENSFTEPALIERSIDVFLSKSDSYQHLQTFNELKKTKIMGFGNELLNWTLNLSDKEIENIYNQEKLAEEQDRIKHNITMLKVGLEILSKFIKDKVNLKVNIEKYKKAATNSQMKAIKESGTIRTVVDNILEAIFVMNSKSELDNGSVDFDDTNGTVALYIAGVYPDFKKWARETQFEYEILNKKEFLRQLKKMDYYIDYKNKRVNDDIKKVWILDIGKLNNKDIINYDNHVPF